MPTRFMAAVGLLVSFGTRALGISTICLRPTAPPSALNDVERDAVVEKAIGILPSVPGDWPELRPACAGDSVLTDHAPGALD
jgi:hypothetical protein